MKKAVLFDLDDTLWASEEMSFKEYSALAEKFGLKLPSRKEYSRGIGKPVKEHLRECWPEVSREKFDAFFAFAMDNFSDLAFPLIDKENNVLDWLKQKGFLTGILTSRSTASFNKRYPKAGLKPELFDFIQLKEDTEFHKPDRRVFDKCVAFFRKKGVGKEDLIYVGDSVHDFAAANDAGILFIAVLGGNSSKKDFAALGLPGMLAIPSILDLPAVLEKKGWC